MNRHVLRQRPHLVCELLRFRSEIRLVQDDHRSGAAVPGDDQVPLDAARIEVAVQTGDEKHRIDVGGDDLLFRRIAGGAA